jgi:MFS family permease
MRKLTAINFIHQFFWAVVVITLPLYLIEKDINVEEIGLILSLIPLAMLVLRTLGAMFSDIIGTRLFFVYQGIFQMVAAGIYSIASTPLHFGLGKISEGSSYSLFWAVDRTAIFSTATKKGEAAAKMTSVRMVAGAIGLLFGGYMAYLFSFEFIYQILIGLGLVTVVLAVVRHNVGAHRREKLSQTLELGKKHSLFWETSIAMAFAVASNVLFLNFLIPVFMDLSLNADYVTIGLAMAIYFTGTGIGSYAATWLGLVERKLFPYQLLTLPLMVALPYSGGFFIPILFLVGTGTGVVWGMYEELIAEITREDTNLSTSIALLHVPVKVFEFSSLAAAGFIFVIFGGEVLFILSAVLLLVYLVLADRVLKKMEKGAGH